MSEILKTISKSTAVKFLINPIRKVEYDIRELLKRRKIPEHIAHGTLTTIAFALGIATPFLSSPYKNWMSNLVFSCGLTSTFSNTLGVLLISSWAFSYCTSALTEGATMLICKLFFGDWTYRMTSRECIQLSKDFAIPSYEIRNRFNELVSLYRNPPKITGITEEYIQRILDKFLDGYFGAVEDHDSLRQLILDRKTTLEKRKAILERTNPHKDTETELETLPETTESLLAYGFDRYKELNDLGKTKTLTKHEASILKELVRLNSYLTKHNLKEQP